MSKEKTLEKKASVSNSIGRFIFVAVSILIQVAVVLHLVMRIGQEYVWIESVARGFAIILVVAIYSQHKTSAVKTPWIILIMLFPITGTLLYLLVGLSGSTKKMKKRYSDLDSILMSMLPENDDVIGEIYADDQSVANMTRYLKDRAGFPIYKDSDITYYADASDALEAQKKALKDAREFIFMEYHAIEDAEAFAAIKEILAKKAAEGLDVRVFYDDVGSVGFINPNFVANMENLGIKCRAFNPMTIFVNIFLNNRDHRKITVIDGNVGFTGGYNLANEYFNLTHPYGHWKDTGVKIEGNAVSSLTVLFLEMWNAIRDADCEDADFSDFIKPEERIYEQKAYIQPYGDTPLDKEHVGQNVYMNIICAAEKYVWIMTPYLIITDEMSNALCLAASRGVDVRIVTPGIPDKRTIYSMTRSYYRRLIEDGVRIFEYTPGFSHGKMCISDGKVATCGTINMDYRSLYHHFENGVLMYRCKAVQDMEEDFKDVFSRSFDVTEEHLDGTNYIKRAWQSVLRLFSALA